MRAAMLCLLAGGFGCQPTGDLPVTFLSGLRVLGIKAEPPEVAAGGSSTVTALAIDTDGAALAATWAECVLPPLPGQAVNPDCVVTPTASYLDPAGEGLSITAIMPDVTPAALGQPDSTGGVYLPLVARITTNLDSVLAIYRLRLAQTTPVNQNPQIATVFLVDDSGMRSLDESTPLTVASGGQLQLGVSFAPGSAEAYTVPPSSAVVTETLTTSWFCTAGDLSVEKTSDTQPYTVLRLDKRLPVSGTAIDLYAVSRDERGGTDYAHRSLQLQ